MTLLDKLVFQQVLSFTFEVDEVRRYGEMGLCRHGVRVVALAEGDKCICQFVTDVAPQVILTPNTRFTVHLALQEALHAFPKRAVRDVVNLMIQLDEGLAVPAQADRGGSIIDALQTVDEEHQVINGRCLIGKMYGFRLQSILLCEDEITPRITPIAFGIGEDDHGNACLLGVIRGGQLRAGKTPHRLLISRL